MIRERKPYNPGMASVCTSRKRQRLNEVGAKIINKELDAVQFIRQQMMVKVVLKLLFSKEERLMIRKNKRFTLGQRQLYLKESTDSDGLTTLRNFEPQTEHQKWLLEQAFREKQGKHKDEQSEQPHSKSAFSGRQKRIDIPSSDAKKSTRMKGKSNREESHVLYQEPSAE